MPMEPGVAPKERILTTMWIPVSACKAALGARHLYKQVMGERGELFQPDQSDILDFPLPSSIAQVVVDWAAAQDDPFHLLRWDAQPLPSL